MTFAEAVDKSVSSAVILIEIVTSTTTYYYCKTDYTPIGSSHLYEGRLQSLFDISFSRDPLTWGRLEFPTGSITLNNGDGYFDSFATPNWFAGWYDAKVILKLGYAELDISDYVTLYTGHIESLELSPTEVSISIKDARKKFDIEIEDYSWEDTNAMVVLREAIEMGYPDITFDSAHYDTTTWSSMESLAPEVTVDFFDPISLADLIDKLCVTCFGIFFMTNDDRYSFKIPDLDATCENVIQSVDVMDVPSVTYDASNVVSSVKVYCDIDLDPDSGEYAYIWEDTTRQAYVLSSYSVLNDQEVFTYLPGTTAASVFGIQFLDYTCDVHPEFTITVPMKYYTLDIGDTVLVEITRNNSVSYIGETKCEIIGKTYKLDFPSIEFNLRQWYDEA